LRIVNLAAIFAIACAVSRTAAADSPQAGTNAIRVAPYTWRNVVIGGGGFVTAVLFHPTVKDLVYARTDVGGAYRWDAGARRWVPITDWIGPDDVNLTGIESIAVDASHPDRVYLAAGTYGDGNAAMLRSDDRGKTFQRTNVPIRMGGNETGRFNGERLAVDPNQGDILFFGSRSDGLWKSGDAGATWQKVDGFPDTGSSVSANTRFSGGFGRQAVGIVCVAFDPASGVPGVSTPNLYAAVSTTGTNLFTSRDGGTSWTAVPGQPVGLRPNHFVLAPDGACYLTYGKEPGPNSMTDGAVWKYNPASGSWKDITPVKPATSGQPFGYGAVAVDALHPSTVMVTTFNHWKPHDEIYRSTNSGSTWTAVWRNNTHWDYSSAPYTKARTPHWMGDIQINPFDPDQVMFTTGYGIWSCVNATAEDAGRSTRWVFLDDGLEETVPLALISPPAGAHLLSGLGDIDGFRHEDITVSPASTFEGPLYGNTEDLAFAGRHPSVMARTGTARPRPGLTRGACSLNGGKTWKAFPSEPANSAGAGAIAVSADGQTIVWTPRRGAPSFSRDRGRVWTACAGLSSGLRVVVDDVNPGRFYAYDSRAARLFVSTNGASGFFEVAVSLPASQGFPGGFGGGGGEGAMLAAAPGREGDLWLAFRRGGLLHSTDGGLSFSRIAAVEEAHSIGFGKAAAGKTYPALFLAGRVQGLSALFRSDDGGQSWVRINDDQHQYGWINHVTGDPRIFGRVYFATGGRGVICGDPK
jgi:photosystem II stability/assembly factor-like uncharacterized protein